jgi:hypothetical protein
LRQWRFEEGAKALLAQPPLTSFRREIAGKVVVDEPEPQLALL